MTYMQILVYAVVTEIARCLTDRDEGWIAVQVLRDLGYLNVGSLKGGLQGWLEAGGLVDSSGGRNSGSSRQTRPIWARSDW